MQYPDYDRQSPNTPLTEAELQGLDELLQGLPADGVMTLDGLDGYLTALLVGPPVLDTLRTADWLPLVWGGDPEGDTAAPFASNQKRKRTTVLVLRHLQALACQLRDAPSDWEPIFNVAERPDSPVGELADATGWCLGFLQATDLAADAWAPLFADPELGPGLAAIALLGGDEDLVEPGQADLAGDDDLDDPEVIDQLSRAAAEVVLALHARANASAAR